MSKNNQPIVLTSQDSIPQASVGAGTITSNSDGRHIIGDSTAFLSELSIDDWVYIKAQNAFRRVESIQSDTELYVDEAFDTPLAGAAYDITPASRFTEISFLVTGAVNVTVDGVTYTPDTSQTYSKASGGGSTRRQFVDPIDIDASGSEVIATVLS